MLKHQQCTHCTYKSVLQVICHFIHKPSLKKAGLVIQSHGNHRIKYNFTNTSKILFMFQLHRIYIYTFIHGISYEFALFVLSHHDISQDESDAEENEKIDAENQRKYP